MPTKSKNLSPSKKAVQSFALSENEPSVCVRIGVIGCGYWGPNLIRNFNELPGSKVAAVCDLKPDRLKPLSKKFPNMRLTSDFQDLLKDPAIDAIVIATPISTHYQIAKSALRAGKHILIEKPLCETSAQAMSLVRLAARHQKILMVGHTFEYHPAVIKIAELLSKGEIGQIHYLDSVRVNLGLYQSDGLNVIWDLAPHDISIILHWLKAVPLKVSAWGHSFVRKGIEDVAFVRLEFPGDVLAHLHLSWLAPAKIRRITLVGNKKMIIYDDLENVEKIKIADQGAHLDNSDPALRVGYRMGDIVSPRVQVAEPLAQECSHFVDCILRNKNPKTDGENGLRVVRVLEAIDKSLKKSGAVISL